MYFFCLLMSYGTVRGRVCTMTHSPRCSPPSEVKGNRFEFLWNSIRHHFQSTTLLITARGRDVWTMWLRSTERREMFSVVGEWAGVRVGVLVPFPSVLWSGYIVLLSVFHGKHGIIMSHNMSLLLVRMSDRAWAKTLNSSYWSMW